MDVSIIIPFFNQWKLTHARLYELTQHVYLENVEIVLMDDASTELDCQAGVAWWQKNSLHNIRYKRNEENLGFGGNCNEGARVATGDILVFLSNDVIIKGNFLVPLIRILAEKSSHALVGGRIVNWDSGWNTFQVNGKSLIVPYCEGWLIACAKKTWNDLGGFDPIYQKYDYEDICLSTTAQTLGIPLIALDSPYLDHISGVTIRATGADRHSQTVKNKEAYRKKWESKFESLLSKI